MIKFPSKKDIRTACETEFEECKKAFLGSQIRTDVEAQVSAYEDGILWAIQTIKKLNKNDKPKNTRHTG